MIQQITYVSCVVSLHTCPTTSHQRALKLWSRDRFTFFAGYICKKSVFMDVCRQLPEFFSCTSMDMASHRRNPAPPVKRILNKYPNSSASLQVSSLCSPRNEDLILRFAFPFRSNLQHGQWSRLPRLQSTCAAWPEKSKARSLASATWSVWISTLAIPRSVFTANPSTTTMNLPNYHADIKLVINCSHIVQLVDGFRIH